MGTLLYGGSMATGYTPLRGKGGVGKGGGGYDFLELPQEMDLFPKILQKLPMQMMTMFE